MIETKEIMNLEKKTNKGSFTLKSKSPLRKHKKSKIKKSTKVISVVLDEKQL